MLPRYYRSSPRLLRVLVAGGKCKVGAVVVVPQGKLGSGDDRTLYTLVFVAYFDHTDIRSSNNSVYDDRH